METVLVAVGTGFCSFIGSYAALKVHITYLRRDVDKALGVGGERISELMRWSESRYKLAQNN